jgi:hypothetical protein
MPLWLIILIILALAFILYFALRPVRTTPATWGINNVILTVSPTTVTCESGTQFACKIDAFGYADNATPRNFKVELYDDEAFDDLLDTYTSGSATAPGITPTQIPGSALFNWTKSHTFNLWCNSSCEVEGNAGSSGESDPSIYAIFTVMHGNPYPSKESARVTIKCVPA